MLTGQLNFSSYLPNVTSASHTTPFLHNQSPQKCLIPPPPNKNNNRDTTNVEPEMYDYTSNNWSYWNSNEKLKEKFGSCTRKTFDRFTTKDSYTWNITHNTESTAV